MSTKNFEKLIAINKATKAVDDAEKHRERLIMDAYQDGIPIPRIAEAAGVSRQSMHKYINHRISDEAVAE